MITKNLTLLAQVAGLGSACGAVFLLAMETDTSKRGSSMVVAHVSCVRDMVCLLLAS